MEVSTITDQGTREEQQDRILNYSDRWAVCDGHGEDGGEFASYLVELAKTFPKKTKSLKETFHRLESLKFDDLRGGTTFAGAFKVQNKFILCQLGDSRIFYSHKGKVRELDTHAVNDPNNSDVEKLKKQGVRFQWNPNGYNSYILNCFNSYLAMTRAFGDDEFKGFISGIPHIYTVEAEAIVITSDGFTGNIKIIEDLIDEHEDAAYLLKQQRFVNDNFSAIVIYND